MRALILLLALAASGCSESSLVPPSGVSPGTLDQARALWAASGADDYAMTLTRSCFCPEDYRGPFDVSVASGTVTSVSLAGDALPTDRALTVDALFDLLEEAYEQNAARVDVTYDTTLGYPTSLYIDFDEQIADEEIGYTVEHVRPI